MNRGKHTCFGLSLTAVFILVSTSVCPAVTTVLTRHKASGHFLKGETENLVIDSDGTLCLSRQIEPIDLPDADSIWAINCVLPADNALYLGTSPNGILLKQQAGKTETIYPALTDKPGVDTFRNEHIFAMASDVAGRLLAGVSGKQGKLIRFGTKTETLFESDDDKYIFAIVLDKDGFIYLGTGPEGNIYRIPAFGGKAEKIFHCRDKNILSLAFAPDGFLIAGTDNRGLVYKINPRTQDAGIIFNSEKAEVTALTSDDEGNIYVAVSSAAVHSRQIDSATAALSKLPGRPDVDKSSKKDAASIRTANTSDSAGSDEAETPSAPPPPSMRPSEKGGIYKITPEGFAVEILSEKAIFYSLTWQDGKLLAATGSRGRAYSIDPETDKRAIIYEDEKSAQITSIAAKDQDLLLGLSNPAKLIRLGADLAPSGTYKSELIDAKQPARWGKLQLEADIPPGCSITMACRSGNVDEPNDPTFSPWTAEVEVRDPVDMTCPVARYMQYRLTLHRSNPDTTPVIREVAAAHSIPNLAPRVQTVEFQRNKPPQTGVLKIVAKAKDDNNDDLVYDFDFRLSGRDMWIRAKENSDKPMFEWDTQTVEDGRYEVRITADDKPSNSPDQALTGSRVSDILVVDNTPPQIESPMLNVNGSSLILQFRAVDQFSAIGKVQYTLDSSEDWAGVLPVDLIFDTMTEQIVLKLEDIKPGEHILTLAVSDDPGNKQYQSFPFQVRE